MNKLKEIKQMPTTHDNVHESIYKSHATLQLVKDMLKRGDSNESILMVIDDVYDISEYNASIDDMKDNIEKTLIEKFPDFAPLRSSTTV